MRKLNSKKATCHPDRPHQAKGLCNSCYVLHLRNRSVEDKEKYVQVRKQWLKNNPDYEKNYKKEEILKKGGSSYQRTLDLKKLYGITKEQYNELFTKQNGCCAICGRNKCGKKRNYLSVDHCHDSKKVRGLLCLSCNCGLGYFKDSVEFLKAAILYLENNERN